jgi:hypothetical protein
MPCAEATRVLLNERASKTFFQMASAAVLALTAFAIAASPASAISLGPLSPFKQQLKQDSPIIDSRTPGIPGRLSAVA